MKKGFLFFSFLLKTLRDMEDTHPLPSSSSKGNASVFRREFTHYIQKHNNNHREALTDAVGKLFDEIGVSPFHIGDKPVPKAGDVVTKRGEWVDVKFNSLIIDRMPDHWPVYVDTHGNSRTMVPPKIRIRSDEELETAASSERMQIEAHVVPCFTPLSDDPTCDMNEALDSVMDHLAQCFFLYGVDLRKFTIQHISVGGNRYGASEEHYFRFRFFLQRK